jgi:hypothetical protein
MKNAETHSWAIARAAAFQTDTNDSTAGVEKTTCTDRGARNRGMTGTNLL